MPAGTGHGRGPGGHPNVASTKGRQSRRRSVPDALRAAPAAPAFDRFGGRPHPSRCSGDACAGSEPKPRSPRRAATRSPRLQHSPGDHPSQGPSPHVPAGRPGKVLTGHDVQTLPGAAARRAPLSRRTSRRCAAPTAPPRRRSAPLLRHERLSDNPRPRPPHGRCGLPDLRLRAPARLTRVTPARCDGGPSARWTSPVARAGHGPGTATVDRSWITRPLVPNLVDRPPCGCRPRRAIIWTARRGRDERTAVPPQGGRAPRKGSRIFRKEGRPFRKGGSAVRRLHRCRKVPDPLARAGGAPQGAPQLPARVASPPQGGRGSRVGGPFGRFAARHLPVAVRGNPPTWM